MATTPVPEVNFAVRIPKRFFDGRGIIDQGIQNTRDAAKAEMLSTVKQVFRIKRGRFNTDLIATGRLYGALKARLRQSGSGWYNIVVTAEGEPAKYLPYVEDGMPKGKRINIPELLQWMEARGIDAPWVVGNIARSLTRKGYPGKHPMREAQSRIRPQIRKRIETAVNRAAKRWIEG